VPPPTPSHTRAQASTRTGRLNRIPPRSSRGRTTDPVRPEVGDEHVSVVPDLGTDRIEIYEVDYDEGSLRPADLSPAELDPGAGPRHLTFHPDESVAYVINELDGTITAFEREAETGGLETVETLPPSYVGDNHCGDVHAYPSGDWLYGSNRGHDRIVVMSIDKGTSGLEIVAHVTGAVNWPRHFALDPTGRYLFVENNHSDTIVTFEIDEATGDLTRTEHRQ